MDCIFMSVFARSNKIRETNIESFSEISVRMRNFPAIIRDAPSVFGGSLLYFTSMFVSSGGKGGFSQRIYQQAPSMDSVRY